MKRPKEKALQDYIKIIRCSWTYNRLTEPEKASLNRLLSELESDYCDMKLTGAYQERQRQTRIIYAAFLYGCGYNPANGDWRSENKTA